jgi:superfamily II DNA/RNA helicase
VTKIRGKAKSYKADGTPKKRWSAAERAAKGLPPRKGGGRPRNQRDGEGFRGDRFDRGDRGDRGDRFERRDRSDWNDRGDRGRRWDDRGENRWSDDRRDNRRGGRDDNRGENRWSNDRRDARRGDRDDFRGDRRGGRDDSRGGKWEDRGRRWEDRGGDRRESRWQDRDDRGRREGDRRPHWEDRGERRPDRRDQRRGEHRPRHSPSWEVRDRRREERRDRDDFGAQRSWDRRDRDDRGYRGDRAWDRDNRGFRDDRGRGGGDRDRRSFERRDFDRPERDRDEFDTESADTMSWSATELEDVDATAVADDAGFAELGVPKVLVAALDQQGITTPFPIQTATIPDALSGKDVLGRGRTGSGKTLGFGLPMLARLANGDAAPSGAPGGVVLVPTRELALQVADVLAPLAKVIGLSTTLVAGGMAFGPQIKAFDRGVDVVVATPGRLIDLMEQGVADLSQVQVAVLDEADHMADLGFMTEVTTILDAIPVGGQRLLFSATLDRGVDRLVEKYLTDPVTHEVDEAKASISTMHHHLLHVLPHDKNATTAAIANREGRTVVFVRTQRGADRVADQLRAAGVMAGALHGGLTQGARARILRAFKAGTVPVLVATDVAARGIHVDEVTMVLQVDPPMGPKDYLHRAGRTARAGQEGHVATITLPHQRKMMRRITGQAGVQVEPVQVRPDDELLTDLVGARVPEGEPIGEEDYQALIAPPRPVRKRGPRKKGWGRDAWDNERGGRGGRGGRSFHRRGPRD